MVSRYLIRPHNEVFEPFCYALFIKRYQLKRKPIENDSQPEQLIDKLVETNHPISNSYREVLVLSSGERLHYRKVELVLRYHVPNKFKDPEGYAHHLLFMFYLFRDKSELKVGQPSSYSSKLSEPGVLEIVNNNKSLAEPYSDLVNAAFLNYRTDITPSWDPFSMKMFKMSCARWNLKSRQKYLVLMKKIKLTRITQKKYLLNSIQPFLVTVRLIVKLDL